MIDRATPIMLEDKYRLRGEIGRGGMGLVFHAEDVTLARSVAVKFLLPELVENRELVDRFHTEALAMASVFHPNVAQIYSYGWFGKIPYFVMEYSGGHTVDVLIDGAQKRNGTIPLFEALHILDQAAAGLHAVHGSGVVHRDVKPANLISEPDTGRVVIMDFGIGHRVVPGIVSESVSVGGTPAYMAPEIISGEPTRGENAYLADIYSLGITAFEVLTGRLPCAFRSWVEAVTWHLVDQPEAPSAIRRDLPIGLDALVLRCLEKDPLARFQSALAFREALKPFLAEARTRVRPRRKRSTAPPPPSTPPPGRRPSHVVRAREPSIALVRPGPALQRMVRQAIERESLAARVESVETIHQAMAMVRGRRAQVIVGRLHDPEMNGMELAALAAGDEDLEHLGIILTCDEDEPEEKELLRQLGVAGLLSRPISPKALSDALRRAIPGIPESVESLAG